MTLTYDELLGQVRQLTLQERLALIEATTQMLKEDLHLQPYSNGTTPTSANEETGKSSPDDYVPFVREDWLHLNEETNKAQQTELRGTSVEKILGIGWAATNGRPPSDAENKEEYLNYLMEKYS